MNFEYLTPAIFAIVLVTALSIGFRLRKIWHTHTHVGHRRTHAHHGPEIRDPRPPQSPDPAPPDLIEEAHAGRAAPPFEPTRFYPPTDRDPRWIPTASKRPQSPDDDCTCNAA